MSNNQDNYKRMARNTAFLYVRMLFAMLVSLYASRVVLNTLGIEDYGIYNVVGGVVSLFAVLNSAMTSGTLRFLNYEMGTGNNERLGKVFSTSLSIHIVIAIIILVLAETIGLWFVNTQMVIPPDRMYAANWVYQFSIFASMISLTQVPYTAAIIAHERMQIYGYVGILEAVLRLVVVLLLVMFMTDKLILYAFLVFLSTIIIALIYRMYCVRHFPECKFSVCRDRTLYIELTGFAGWNLFGSIAQLCTTQGQDILLNLFFGPMVNAARAVAVSINGVVMQFVSNFQTAVNPQIVKSYAANDLIQYEALIIRIAKFSFIMFFVFAAPILAETEFLLDVWLKNPPVNSAIFSRLIIINVMLNVIVESIYRASLATGKIRTYQIVVGLLVISNIPLSYIFLKNGCSVLSTFYTMIILSVISVFVKLFLLKKVVHSFRVGLFIRTVIVNCAIMTIIILLFVIVMRSCIEPSLSRSIMLLATVPIMSLLTAYLFCLTKSEKGWINGVIRNKVVAIISKC